MLSSQYNRYYLFALVAIVLLLQSFAVWHDAEHSFHATESQCERLNAINHLPLVNISPDLTASFQTNFIVFESLVYAFYLPTVTRLQHAIRAPPVFS